jgi:hypothetical protein
VLIPPLLLLNLFVVVVMFSIGLRVSGGELLDILRKQALFVRTLLANCVLIPAIGFLLVRIFPLTPDASVGILLLAAIPGTPIALQFTRQAKTRLVRREALNTIRGPRDDRGDAPIAAFVHIDRLADRRTRPRVTPGVGDLHRHAQRDCRAVRGALLLSGH